MKAICPKNPNHKEFITTAHELHEWVVANDGEFIEDKGCLSIASPPDSDNIWTCKECGTEAINEN